MAVLKRFILFVLLFLVISGLSVLAQEQPPDYASFEEFKTALDTVIASGDSDQLDAFWNALVESQQIPLTFGETVVFLYRGKARAVKWYGDFNGWKATGSIKGEQLGESDLWMGVTQLPIDARVDYKIVVDFSERVDPANPRIQVGGYGPNSELAMPDYVYSEWVVPRDDIEHGVLGDDVLIESASLKYALQYRVYTPAGYDALSDLPVIYVTDGQDYANPEMGVMVTVLDNLIADSQIQPVIAVFIDPRNPYNLSLNRREYEDLENPKYAKFVAEELVPAIDAQYKTAPMRDARALIGTSYGAVAVTYIQLLYPDIFSLVALQSPAFYTYFIVRKIPQLIEDADITMPVKVFIASGIPEWDVDYTKILEMLDAKGIPYRLMPVNQGHSWGQWRTELDDILIYFFGEEA